LVTFGYKPVFCFVSKLKAIVFIMKMCSQNNALKNPFRYLGIIAGGTLAAALFLCIIYWRRYGRTCSLNEYRITTQRLLSDISCSLPIYTYREIERATNSFAETNILGTGGYGTVYVGKLLVQNNSTEDLVAIKRIRYRADVDSINQVRNSLLSEHTFINTLPSKIQFSIMLMAYIAIYISSADCVI
jgi:hypothetical protein